MANHDYKSSGKDDRTSMRSSAEDTLDRALDAALAKYSDVEPRAALNERILANLRAEPTPAVRAWWRWGLVAGAVAVVLVALALAWRSGSTKQPEITQHPRVVAPSAPEAPQIAHHDRNIVTPPNPPIRTKAPRRPKAEVAATAPKLDVFPSPQPLSDQELALARYVRNFPADAKAVAKEQADAEKEVLAKMQALANESAE